MKPPSGFGGRFLVFAGTGRIMPGYASDPVAAGKGAYRLSRSPDRIEGGRKGRGGVAAFIGTRWREMLGGDVRGEQAAREPVRDMLVGGRASGGG